jgi:hypothetical protein
MLFITRVFFVVCLAVPIGLSGTGQAEQVVFSKGLSIGSLTIVRLANLQLKARLQRTSQPDIEIALPTSDANFTEAFTYLQSRLVLISQYSPTLVIVLDIPTATVADRFLAERPVVSPNSRYIAYTKPVGRLARVDTGAVYLVYDLAKDSTGNRMTNPDPGDEELHVGVAVYPAWNRDARSYSGSYDAQGGRTLRKSPLRWVSSDAFAFLHQSENSVSVVLVTLDVAPAARSINLKLAELVHLPVGSGSIHPAAQVIATDIVSVAYSTASCRVRIVFERGLKLPSLEVEF